MQQPVQIHGIACLLTGAAGAYQVTADGQVLASAPSRFLAVARAALAVLARSAS